MVPKISFPFGSKAWQVVRAIAGKTATGLVGLFIFLFGAYTFLVDGQRFSTWLTARLPDADRRSQINIAISADQIFANYYGALTALPSLELATMPQTHKENQEGLNEGYYSHCSFRSPTQAMPAEINPRSVLNRLFGKTGQEGQTTVADPLDRQMLDLVIGGARDLRKKLPHGDQQKLDEYLDSVRSVERRIAAIEHRQKEAALEAAGVSGSKRNDADSPPIEIKIPEGDKRSEYMQVMCDLNVLAFQTDTDSLRTHFAAIGEATRAWGANVVLSPAMGGIVIGLVTAALFDRYHTIKLPPYLGFFGGRRFVPRGHGRSRRHRG